MIEFENDGKGYFEWLAAHPEGYVLNVRPKPDPSHVVLHRASCSSISSVKLGGGAYSNKGNRKWLN